HCHNQNGVRHHDPKQRNHDGDRQRCNGLFCSHIGWAHIEYLFTCPRHRMNC
ncbi:hypothetical protein D030_1601B, partial [Vibrio parahaemolyticus AQ3810]